MRFAAPWWLAAGLLTCAALPWLFLGTKGQLTRSGVRQMLRPQK